MNFKKTGFTLAEMLITLSVIGIVAALTIPGLVKNHNEKAWATAKDLIEKKLVETTRRMNIDGVMTGYSTTESFIEEFGKYMNIIDVCDNSKLTKCYSSKIISADMENVEVSTLKKAINLGQNGWGTNTIGLVVNNGITIIMAYNPNCIAVDPFSETGQKGQLGCLSLLVDVNGKKMPNKVGQDVLLKNAVISNCELKLEGVDFCLAAADLENFTCGDTNWWSGCREVATELCAQKGYRLPTNVELEILGRYVYNMNVTFEPTGHCSYGYGNSPITPDPIRVAETGIKIADYPDYFYLSSSGAARTFHSRYCDYATQSSSGGSPLPNVIPNVRCVK